MEEEVRTAGGEAETMAPLDETAEAMADGVDMVGGEPDGAGGPGAPVPDADRITHGEEAEALRRTYPSFDAEREMRDPLFRALVLGEVRPTLRQVYELCHAAELFGSPAGASAGESGKDVPAAGTGAAEAEAADAAAAPAGAAPAGAAPAAAADAVAAAVAEAEERLLAHIRARGCRPPENGLSASGGVRMHPAVERLTRSDRERLAERAGRGECVTL